MTTPIQAHVHDDGRATVHFPDGDRTVVEAGDDMASTQAAVIESVARYAATQGAPVLLHATDQDGKMWPLTVHPTGRAEVAPADGTVSSGAPVPLPPAPVQVAAPRRSAPGAPAPQATSAPTRSFLAASTLTQPPLTGWRRVIGRLGIQSAPPAKVAEQWSNERAIAQHWPGPRTIAVLNGKGGAGKTPTTILLSALFARTGGAGVLAWDANRARGTLGWRTETGPHESTVLDLVPHAEQLLAPGARAADLAGYVHHQTIDRYDVLRSNPNLLSTDQQMTTAQFDELHALATKYYRLVFVDTGNDEGDPLWMRLIDHTHSIVVPTSTRADHAEAARLLLESLANRDEHSARLATNAVVVVLQADRDEAAASGVAEGFAPLARSVVTIPYDPGMRAQWLRLDQLQRTTHRAWLRAAASVATGLTNRV